MLIQWNLHLLLPIFLLLSPSVMSQMSNCLNTTEAICDGTFIGDRQNRTKHDCTVDLFSPVNLTSCYNGDSTMAVYWFWYDDVCRFNDTRYTPFAIVHSNGTLNCQNISKINITQQSCVQDYNITKEMMIIKNITNSISRKYICFLSNTRASMNYTSTTIYSINVVEPTTSTITPSSTTSSTTTTTAGNTGNSSTTTTDSNTGNSSTTEKNPLPTPDNSLVLKIVLPVVLGVVLIAALIIAGFFYNRRRKRQRQRRRIFSSERSGRHNLERTPSGSNQSSVKTREEIYGEDISSAEPDHGHYSVWRAVQERN